MNEKLQGEIRNWLEYRAKFADYATHTELKMQMMFTDWMGDYDGKDADQNRVCGNCGNVEEAYNFVKNTVDMNVHREYDKEIYPFPPQEG